MSVILDSIERTPFVFEIPEHNFDRLVERLEKMVRRSRKCGLSPPTYTVIHEADYEVEVRSAAPGHDDELECEDAFGRVHYLGGAARKTKIVHYLYVTVEGERPHLSGWDFVATVDHTEQDADGVGNIIKRVPGVGTIPIEYRSAMPICQHCNAARRRNETFIVRNAAGITKQIGRNCLQDFFPGLTPGEVAAQLEWWTEAVELASGAEDEDFFGAGGEVGNTAGCPSRASSS